MVAIAQDRWHGRVGWPMLCVLANFQTYLWALEVCFEVSGAVLLPSEGRRKAMMAAGVICESGPRRVPVCGYRRWSDAVHSQTGAAIHLLI